MSFRINQNESDENRRNVLVHMVDETDRFTPETSIASPTITITKSNETTPIGANGTWTEIGNGSYYYKFTENEVDTKGIITLRVTNTGSADFIKEINII